MLFKKKLFIVPLCLSVLALGFSVVMMVEALGSGGRLPFVGEDGLYEPITESLLGLSHTWFSLILSVLVAVALSVAHRRRYGISLVGALLFGLFLPVQAYLGSKLLYAIERSITLGSISEFSFNGLSMFGGVATTIGYVVIAALIMRKPKRLVFDFVATPGLIIIVGSRMGCFFHHCCGSVCYMVEGKPFYPPLQLFEVVLDLALLSVIIYIDQNRIDWRGRLQDAKNGAREKGVGKWISDTQLSHHGLLAVYVLITYAAYRFVIEFFRDNPSFALGMTFAQYYSVGFMLLCGYILFRTRERRLDAAYKASRRREHSSSHKKK